MAITIDKAYVDTFDANVLHLIQQMSARLTQTVDMRYITGQSHSFTRLGVLEAHEKTGPRKATPTQDAPWDTRVSMAKTFDIGTTIEPEDPSFMLADPKSNLTQTIASGMKRKQDDIIIQALIGTALDGDGATHALPTTQVLNKTNNPISQAIMGEAQTMFLDNHIEPDTQKFAVVHPKAVETIMNTTSATSSDYVSAQQLQKYGIVDNWMGFTWLTSTRLTKPNATNVNALLYTRQALGMQVNRDILTKVAEDPTMSFMWRLYSAMTMGAVRVEDEQVVKLIIAA